MRTAKAALVLLVSASVAAPASAQVRAAAAISGSGVPRVAFAVPLSAPSLLAGAPVSALSAPGLTVSAFAAAPLAAAPAALPALSAPSLAALPSASAPLPARFAAALPGTAAPALSPALAAASAPLARSETSRGAPSAPASAESERSSWEGFWSGAAPRAEDGGFVPAGAPADGRATAPLTRPSRAVRPLAAAVLLAPVAHGFHSVLAHVAPFAEGGAVLVGAYFANRGLRALLDKFAAKKEMDRHQVAAIRLAAGVAIWTAAAALALHVGGASPQVMTTVFGAGGTIATLGLRDVLGNVIQGVNFLLTRPYAIGTRVSIDDQVGVVADVTPTMLLIKKDDGAEVKIQHSALAAKSVIVLGEYRTKDARLHLAVPAKPKFQGALGAVWSSLDRRFWLAAAAFAVLTAAPGFVGFLAAGWAATAVHVALAGSIAWLTRRVDLALTAAVDKLAEQNGWRPETRALARLAVGAALWSVGGGAALRLVGVSWAMLGASVGVTTLGIGLASNNFFGSVVQGAEVLFSKPFKIGDQVKIGAFQGIVEDMTLYHVVIKLDEGRHALVPYAVVRDATLVVTPGQNNK